MNKQITICLDPGHGEGYNHSTVTPEYYEGTRMWEYSQILIPELQKYGFKVVTTRPSIDDDPSLNQRGKIAGECGADLMLSLHSNAPSSQIDPITGKKYYDPTVKGMVTVPSIADLDFNRPLAEMIAQADGEVMGSGVRAVFTQESKTYPGEDYYGVLRWSVRYGCKHAIIIEHGFHTNPEDSQWLMSDDNLKILAQTEARVVCDYFGIDRKFDEDTLVEGVKAGYIAKVIDAEGDVFIPNKQEALIAIAQCMKDMYYNGSYGKTLQEVLDNNFTKPYDYYHKESLQAVEDVFVNGIVRNSNWKILQYRSYKKYANKDGTYNQEKCKDILDKYVYLGKDGISPDWGHFYFGYDSSLVGDVNCDGEVNINDVSMLLDQLHEGAFTDSSDVNRDGVVNILDVTALNDILTNQKKGKVMIELNILKRGDKNYQVKTVQRLLTQIGYRDSDGKYLDVDGNFGSKTEYAVKNFQRDNKLDADGEVGKYTWDKLLKNE